MSAPDPGSDLARVLRAHASEVDPWLRRAAAAGAEGTTVRAALAEVEPVAAALGTDRAVLAAVRAVLDLLGRGRWHPGRAQRTAVLEVLPALASWADEAPDVVVPAVVAAADVVGRAGRLDAWAARLGGPPPPPEHLRGALLVAAWRSGLPRYRDAALRTARELPAEVLGPLLDLDPSTAADAVARHADDAWWWPGGADGEGVLARVGGLRPWGGSWLDPPVAVAGGPTGWAVAVGDEAWAVVADVHGSALVPLPGGVPLPGPPAAVGRLPVPWDDDVTGVAPAPGGRVLLVSRAHSYRLEVVRVEL